MNLWCALYTIELTFEPRCNCNVNDLYHNYIMYVRRYVHIIIHVLYWVKYGRVEGQSSDRWPMNVGDSECVIKLMCVRHKPSKSHIQCWNAHNPHTLSTVLGPVSPSELGHTLTHEHLLLDGTPFFMEPHELRDLPITMETLGKIRYKPYVSWSIVYPFVALVCSLQTLTK